ncbi:MAG: segregation/condensation protein A [Clostridia bacterium]
MDNIFDNNPMNDVEFKLSNFEGPLDLLLHLIKMSKMSILEVKLAELTDQYLEYMQDIATLDMEEASYFLTIAAHLLEIKSRSVLPRVELAEDEDEEDEESKLKRKLIEYNIFKEASGKLQQTETIYRFYKEPDYTEEDARVAYNNFSLDKLIESYARIMAKAVQFEGVTTTKKIEKDPFTVADKIRFVSQNLLCNKQILFSALFGERPSKSEVINTFLALLELLKKQIAEASQEDWQGEIVIKLCDNIDEKNIDITKLAITEVDFD